MIYTLTLNPTLDRTLVFEELVVGELNRAYESRLDLSGKGVNVSMALREWGHESVIMGFAAGRFGKILETGLGEEGFECAFVHVSGETRSNVTVIDASRNQTTKLNEPGPTVTKDDLRALEEQLWARLQPNDICFLSGSLPPGAPSETYAQLIKGIRARDAIAVLDTSGEPLAVGCRARPNWAKPNAVEAKELVDTALDTDKEIHRTLSEIRSMGPELVLMSLDSRGAAIITKQGTWFGHAPHIQEVSAVGAGDCLLTGAFCSWLRGEPAQEVLRWGVASGTAAALGAGSAMPTRTAVEAVINQVVVTPL